jgi:hypothetical protein
MSPCKGSPHHASKLDEETVSALRKLVMKNVCLTCAVKALDLKVSMSTAWDAAYGNTWKHVDLEAL